MSENTSKSDDPSLPDRQSEEQETARQEWSASNEQLAYRDDTGLAEDAQPLRMDSDTQERDPQDEMASKAGRETEQAGDGEIAEGDAADHQWDQNGCVVVGIGASAGGLDAFKKLIRTLPTDGGIAYVLVQHLDPSHKSLMADLLSKHTDMPVQQVQDAEPIRPNHIYMIPPNRYLRVRDGGLFLETPTVRSAKRMPIDHFFSSLAASRRRRAICIVLSGTGSDGTFGLKEVKEAGGMALVQEPQTAEYDGMPQNAVATGMVDFVVPIEEMSGIIQRYVKHPYVQTSDDEGEVAERSPSQFRTIINLLRAHTDHDFRCYKTGTLHRRIQRRMSLLHLENLDAYVERLRNDPEELQLLFKDLLISVTSFFRDPEAWAELEEVVAGQIDRKDSGDSVRIWIAGCATGEEAYSAAMVVEEKLRARNTRLEVQIFATDVDAEAISFAREGSYSENVASCMSAERLENFFQQENGRYRVNKRLREACIFAVQNLVGDPPFSNLDLIICRNVMIYLEPSIQQRVAEMFHFALSKQGALFLGTSESVAKHSKLFAPINKHSRIYRKIGSSNGRSGRFPIAGLIGDRPRSAAAKDRSRLTATPADAAKEVLLEQFAPTAVLVNRDYEVQYFHGAVRRYLDFPSGEPTTNLSVMAIEGLKSKVRGAVLKAFQEKDSVSVVATGIDRGDEKVNVRIEVVPVPPRQDEELLVLVTFRDETPPQRLAPPEPSGSERDGESRSQAVQQLEYELQATREDLQSTIEELETSNEELKASNEEIMSMNEELQSTNEELETSREELQSLNEELNTVNSQLEDKLHELEDTNNDLTNLLTSTDVATIFLDTDLRIRRFTPATTELLRVIPGDVGRQVADLAPRVNDPDLLSDATRVLDKLLPVEKEVTGSDGRAFLRKILPYRTAENRIDGVVVTFSDVTSIRNARLQLEFRERQQAAIAELGQVALTGEDLQSLLEVAVRRVRDMLDVPLVKVLKMLPRERELVLQAGMGWNGAKAGQTRVPSGHDSQAGFTVEQAGPVIVRDLAKDKRFNGPQLLREHGVVSGMSVIIGPVDKPWGVLGAHDREQRDFTVDDVNFIRAVANILSEAIANGEAKLEILDREKRLRTQFAELEAVYQQAPVGLAVHDRDLKVLRINERLATINGISAEETIGKRLSDVCPSVSVPAEKHLRSVLETGEAVMDTEISGSTPADPAVQRYWNASYYPIRTNSGEIEALIAVVQEITARKRYEQSRTAAYAVAHELARRNEIEEAIPAVLHAFAKPLELTLCEFWQLNREGKLHCTHFCVPGVPAEEESSFQEQFDNLLLEPEESLVGKTLSTGEVQVVTDLSSSDEFMRMRESRELGIRSGIIFPVFVGKEPFGVLSFFSRRKIDHNQNFNELAESVARDIGQFIRRVRAEEDSERAREAAHAANQAKSEFLANMSHEIRTPLSAILGFASVLSERSEDPDDRQSLEVIRRNGDHLLQIINDILDLSKIEANKMSIQLERVDTLDQISEILSLMSIRAHEKGLQLSLKIKSQIPEGFATDAVRLRQILVNLFSNAIKFTPEGEVALEVSFRTSSRRLNFAVADTGIGISEDGKSHLFEPFMQADSSDARQHGGTGLGLTICRRLASMLNGKITFESQLGQGSRFELSLPVSEEDTAALVDASNLDAAGALRRLQDQRQRSSQTATELQGKILIVDDRPEMRLLTKHFLERASAEVETADDGERGLEAVAAAESQGQPFDLVIMDMQMPGIDGYESCRRLRKEGYRNPIIALTANAMEGDRNACIEAGCDDYVTKPIDTESFISTVARYLSSSDG